MFHTEDGQTLFLELIPQFQGCLALSQACPVYAEDIQECLKDSYNLLLISCAKNPFHGEICATKNLSQECPVGLEFAHTNRKSSQESSYYLVMASL